MSWLLLSGCLLDRTPPPPAPDLLVGVWAAPDGARVELAMTESPGSPGACEGRFAFDQWSPEVGSLGSWNYGTYDPLVLNLVDGSGRSRFLVVDVLDATRARMRMVLTVGAANAPDALDAPDTREVERVPSVARPDAGSCPKPRMQR